MTTSSTADAIMDELFGEVERALHISRSEPPSPAQSNDAVELEDLDLTPEEDVMWIAPYGTPTPPPPAGVPPQTTETPDKSGKNWLTPILLLCACSSALLASVLWSFHLAQRLAQLERPAPTASTLASEPVQTAYTSEMRELLSFTPKTIPPAPVSTAPSSEPLSPPLLNSSPLPIPQTVYVPVYQPPTTALPPVETSAPSPAPEATPTPEKSYTLVGVLSFGDRSSAMFEFEGTVHSIPLGKPVGNTGWILTKVQQRDVVLKRNNETKSVVVGQKL